MTGFIYTKLLTILVQSNYLTLSYYGIICLAIGLFIPLLNQLLSPKLLTAEKATPYECGFEAFNTAQDTLNFQFFIVAVLFIIFDIELFLLLP